ncbi:pre-peptidase C-terminal domain-containing protein [Prochlorococcus marinus]|uniref:pre-peptidase C-terminal domain-containing protein n=1 Tax=Prochlorococcus marinus TaxID=1219 RepID=UPI0022B58B93|nr:pre-peptidase C-terminal domain-containing protein [Prochlorococcus marinus]
MTDVYTANTSTTGSISVGGTATGIISFWGDRDWFRVNLVAGNEYQIDLEGSQTSKGTLSDPYLRGIYNAFGLYISGTINDDGGSGRNSRLTYTPTSTGTYFIAAGGYGTRIGSYTLSLKIIDTTPPIIAVPTTNNYEGIPYLYINENTTFVHTYAANETVTWSLSSDTTSSSDYTKFSISSSGALTFNTAPDYENPTDSLGNNIYALTVNATDTSGNTTSQRLWVDVTDVSEDVDDYTANTSTTGSISVGGTTTGNIEIANDRDWFKVNLVAGNEYQIDLEGSPTSNGTLSDPYLRGIYNSSGVFISGTSNDDGGIGLNSRLTYTPTSTGTYFIATGGYGTRTGSYTIGLTQNDVTPPIITVPTTNNYAGIPILYINENTTFVHTYAANETVTWSLSFNDYTKFSINSSGALTFNTAPDYENPTDSNGNNIYSLTVNATDTSGNTTSQRLWVDVTDVSEDVDDYTANTSTAGSISVGGSKTGSIEVASDQDWFKVNLVSGNIYQIDLEGSPTSNGTLSDPYLRGIYNSSGVLISGTSNDDGGSGRNSRLTYTPTSTGTYFIATGGYGTRTGSYTLGLTQTGTIDDYTANTSTTGSISVGGTTTGNIEIANDRDWFKVNLVAGNEYQIDLEGSPTSNGTLSDPYLRGIYNSSGVFISGTSNDDGGSGRNSRLTYTPTSTGTYYIAASGYESSYYDYLGTYKLTITQTTVADDYTANTSTAGSISVGGSKTGSIEVASDQDWFKVNLVSGNIYQIDLEGSPTSNGTLSDPYLRGIYNSSGVLISETSNDDGGSGRNSRLTYTPTSTGTYFIATGGYGTRTGSYTLGLTQTGTIDDYTANTSTTGSISVGGTTTGNIEIANDRDWFKVNLVAGNEYQIDLEGSPTSNGTLSDPYLRGIYNASGVFISGTSNDDGGIGRNSRLTYTPSSTGTYYIAASGYESSYYDDLGTYKLTITQTTVADDYTANTSTAGSISVGGSKTGSIEVASDQDWFKVNLVSGNIYQIDLEGSPTSNGTLSDPYLRGIYNSSGVLISGTSNDDGGSGRNSRLTYTPTSTGTYFIATGGYGTRTGSYTLGLTQIGSTDDYTANTSTTGKLTVGNSVSSNIEVAGDQDWFAITLNSGSEYLINLEGAPTSNGTLSDPYLRGIYNASGVLISGTSNDDGGSGLNSKLSYTATSTGTYYIATGGYGDAIGTCNLSISKIGRGNANDDFTNDTASSGLISIGGSTTGSIEVAGDEDWFKVNLVAGNIYQIDLEGAPTSNGTLSDPYLRGIYNSSGVLISGTSNDDGGSGRNSRLTYTPTSTGTYYIATAGYQNETGTYKISISNETPTITPSSNFNIEFNYQGPEIYRSYLNQSATFWENVIIGDIPAVNDSVYGIIDDIIIDFRIGYIDGSGGTLGRASISETREGGDRLPYRAWIELDTADVESMRLSGELPDLINHEVCHTFGWGFWDFYNLRSGYDYIGEKGVNEYRTLTNNPSITSVPLENTGGTGTQYGHWRESIFNTELMTGYSDSGSNPLSRLSIAALEDLGYEVNYSAADPFTISAFSTTSSIYENLIPTPSSTIFTSTSNISESSFPNFNGNKYIHHFSESLNIQESPSTIKLDGVIIWDSGNIIRFNEITTGNDYLVELIGSFDKNNPSNASQLKGTLSRVKFYKDEALKHEYIFNDSNLDVKTTLENWSGYNLDLNNLIESRANSSSDDTIKSGAGDDIIILGNGNDNVTGGEGDDQIYGGTGTDTAFYSGSFSDYIFTPGTNNLQIKDNRTIPSNDGTDILTNVEYVEFLDQTRTILGNDINRTPTNITLTSTTFNENITRNSDIATITSTDANSSDTHTYSLVTGAGDGDNTAFTLDGNNLKINSSPDYETKSTYNIRLKTTDAGGLNYIKAFTLSVQDVNETPSNISLSSSSFNENISLNSIVATLSTSDVDSSDTHTYSLVSGAGDGDNSAFTLDGSNLKINSSPDYETKSTYKIRIKTTDASNETYTKSFSLSVNDLNEFTATISGSSSNNNLTSTSSNDSIDGLGGTDTVTFSGKFSDYSFTRGTDTLQIADQRTTGTTDGTDTLKNIEYIQFSDQTVEESKVDVVKTYSGNYHDYKFYHRGNGTYEIKTDSGYDDITGYPLLRFSGEDTTSALRDVSAIADIKATFDQVTGLTDPSGEMFQLYNAAFKRFPDAEGLKYWINVYSSGINTNKVVAASFVRSAEFKSRYGENVTTEEYVTTLYRNVYDRLPDEDGFNYWVGSLNKEEQTRSDVLLNFAIANENDALFTEMTGLS